MWTAILLGLAAVLGFIAWVVFPRPKSRRKQDLKAGPRRFHWVLITVYRGNADPTLLDRDAAVRILQNDWSTKDQHDLRSKLWRYRNGEVNPGFDGVRILWLVELAVSAGWMPLEEANQWNEREWQRVREAYRSWPEYQAAVNEGRTRWWAEIARRPMSDGDRERAAQSLIDAQPLLAAVPWS